MRTKFAPPCSILFMTELQEKILKAKRVIVAVAGAVFCRQKSYKDNT